MSIYRPRITPLYISLLIGPILLAACDQVQPTAPASTPTQLPSPRTTPSAIPSLTAVAEPPTATMAGPPDTATPTLATATHVAIAPVIALTYPGPADLYTVVNVAADDVLNLRTGAGMAYPAVEAIPPYGTEIRITGPEVLAEGAQWVPVAYQQSTGWVNRDYLALQFGSLDESVMARAAATIQALQRRDFEALSTWVHPNQGVRFSPYPYVTSQDLVFSADQVATLPADHTVYLWGYFDGSGHPIELAFSGYFERFVYDADLSHPQVVGYNRIIGASTMINNIAEFYPESVFVEYHIADIDPTVDEFDWSSIRLVFEKKQGEWFLVGIVHAEWTL